ncbi:MAG: hypothetical protein ACOX52_09540 [Verrucomicrobiota bacterium]
MRPSSSTTPRRELRVWLWQTWQRDIEGILIWALNWWTSDAALSGRTPEPVHRPDELVSHIGRAGCPKGRRVRGATATGASSTPRAPQQPAIQARPCSNRRLSRFGWEMLRDGIEDYEYMVILESLMKAQGEQQPAATLQAYRSLLEVPAEITAGMTDFTWSPAPIETHREAVARAIEGLQ